MKINKKYKRKSKFGKSKCHTKIKGIKGGWSLFGNSKPKPSFSSNQQQITNMAVSQAIKHPINSINFGWVSTKLANQDNDIDRMKILLDNPNYVIFTLKPSIKTVITDKKIRHQYLKINH
jgi:hypothetical protein